MTKTDRKMLLTVLDLGGLLLVWAILGARYLPYLLVAFIALPLILPSRR